MVVVKNCSDVQKENVEEAEKTQIQWLITEKDGAENFFMRLFTVHPNGSTPLHSHNWEHEIFVLKGNGKVVTEDKNIAVKDRDVVFVPANEKHQFVNTGDSIFEIICLIPKT